MRWLLQWVVVLLATTPLFAQNTVLPQGTDIEIRNSSTNYPAFRVVKPITQNVPWIQFGTQTNTVFEIAANGMLGVAYGGTGTNSLAGIAANLSSGLVASSSGNATNLTATNMVVNGGLTNNSLTASQSVWTDANKMLITRNASTTVLNLGFQTNQVVTTADGTVTNTFSSAYPAPPVVLITQFGTVNSPTNIVVSVTTTNAVINCGKAGVTNNVLAIRPP